MELDSTMLTGTSTWEVELDATRVVYDPGGLERLGAITRELGIGRALVVTDSGIRGAGHVERAVKILESAGVHVGVFDGVQPNPGEAIVAAGAARGTAAHVDGIVALGGGSTLDCAKGINFVMTNGGRMEDYWGFGKATKPMLPSIGIPTTAGTGSESQAYALISQDGTHAKMACGDRQARFRAVILDPALMATHAGAGAAVAGMDAMTHAVESYVTRTRNPVSTLFAAEAWRLLDPSFAAVTRGTADGHTRGRMLIGSFLAGAAIEHSMLGAAHACANPLTAQFDVVHGIAVGLMIPTVVRFNAAEVGELYDTLHPGGAAGLASRLEELRVTGELPERIRDLDVPRDRLRELAVDAGQQWTAGHNPRTVTEKELLDLYEAAY
jgi:alcohol dehydrogenase